MIEAQIVEVCMGCLALPEGRIRFPGGEWERADLRAIFGPAAPCRSLVFRDCGSHAKISITYRQIGPKS